MSDKIEFRGMTTERLRHLDKTGEKLTDEEWAAGWHYCCEWDGLLIGPGMPEMSCCPHEGARSAEQQEGG